MMWNWLRRRQERRKDTRQRLERERDQRIQSELADGVKVRQQRERHLINELRRLEQVMQRSDR